MHSCFSKAGKTQSLLSFEDKLLRKVLQVLQIHFSLHIIGRNQPVTFFIELVDVIKMFQVDLNMVLMQH